MLFQFDFFPYHFREKHKQPISPQLFKSLINNALEDEQIHWFSLAKKLL